MVTKHFAQHEICSRNAKYEQHNEMLHEPVFIDKLTGCCLMAVQQCKSSPVLSHFDLVDHDYGFPVPRYPRFWLLNTAKVDHALEPQLSIVGYLATVNVC